MEENNSEKNLTILLLFLFSSCVLTGCFRKDKVYENGYFQYIIVGENSRFPDKNNKAMMELLDLQN